MLIELWHRPWARFGSAPQDYTLLRDGADHDTFGPIWMCTPPSGLPVIDGRPGQGKELFQLEDQRRVFALPIPLRPSLGLVVAVPGGTARLSFPGIPNRPIETLDPIDETQQAAISLLNRVKAVWARMREVETATADPAKIWDALHNLWMAHTGNVYPEMDVIVQQARELPATLELLGRAPRRVLRRTQQMIPLSRVQEIDRRTMNWLVRQPGETMEERAGGRQRIRAVAREENLDTLENRVLLSYASLAAAVSRDYAQRHPSATVSRRVHLVKAFEKQCRQLAFDLTQRGVGLARADAAPNFVLQTNSNYRKIWDAWCDLLRRQRVLDELWRWQAHSWEEFCALAVVVALRSIDGARTVATSPLAFQQEQNQGRWIEHVNPLAVFYLPDQNTTVEVQYGPRAGRLRHFGAIIWLRFGSVDGNEILTRWAIWPIWHPTGGMDPSDLDSILASLGHGQQEKLRGGLTIRPVAGDGAQVLRRGGAACMTLAPNGDALRDGLRILRSVLADLLGQGFG